MPPPYEPIRPPPFSHGKRTPLVRVDTPCPNRNVPWQPYPVATVDNRGLASRSGPAIVPEMGQRLKNIAITLLRYLGIAVALALIVLVLEVVVGVLLVEVVAIFN